MKFPRLNLRPAFFALLIAATSWSVSAAEKDQKNDSEATPVVVQRLVITKGALENKKPATLRNVVDYICRIHPEANITLVGVDEVLVGDLVLRSVALFRPPEHVPGTSITSAEMIARKMPIEAMLTAVEAASGYKFKTRGFEPNTFVLLPPDGSSRPRTTEVFNLGTMKQSRLNAQVQEKIRELETELAVLRASYGEKHPMTLDHLARLKALNAQLQETSPSSSDSAKLVERIREVVLLALAPRPGEAEPDFKFHPGANLLVVAGTEEAVEVTRKVIAALEKTP